MYVSLMGEGKPTMIKYRDCCLFVTTASLDILNKISVYFRIMQCTAK